MAFVELDGVEGVRLVSNLEGDAGIGDRVQATFPDLGSRKHLVFVPAGD